MDHPWWVGRKVMVMGVRVLEVMWLVDGNNIIELQYTDINSCDIKLNSTAAQNPDSLPQNESIYKTSFLGQIFPSNCIGSGEEREIYWWIREIWTNVKLERNLTKQILLSQTDYLGLRKLCLANPYTSTHTPITYITSSPSLFYIRWILYITPPIPGSFPERN